MSTSFSCSLLTRVHIFAVLLCCGLITSAAHAAVTVEQTGGVLSVTAPATDVAKLKITTKESGDLYEVESLDSAMTTLQVAGVICKKDTVLERVVCQTTPGDQKVQQLNVTTSDKDDHLEIQFPNQTFPQYAGKKPLIVKTGKGKDFVKIDGEFGKNLQLAESLAEGQVETGDEVDQVEIGFTLDYERSNIRSSGYFDVNLGDGNDQFNGKNTNAVPFKVTPGQGNDTILGSKAANIFSEYNPATGYWDLYAKDHFISESTADGGDEFSSPTGYAEVSYEQRTMPVYVTLDDTANDGYPGEKDNLRSSVNTIRTGTGADVIDVTAKTMVPIKASREVYSGAGNDQITAANSPTTFIASEYDWNRPSIYDGGADDDTISGVPAAWSANYDVEWLLGGPGNDTLMSNGNQYLDALVGGDGKDTLVGGDGPEAFMLAGTTGKPDDSDTVKDTGTDPNDDDTVAYSSVLQLSYAHRYALPSTDFSVLRDATPLSAMSEVTRSDSVGVTLDGAANDGATGENDDIQADVQYIAAGDGDDTISQPVEAIYGFGGNDTLSQAQYLEGNDGNDTLRTAPGSAPYRTLVGGTGDDHLFGSDLDDWLVGREGNDELVGGDGNDTLDGNWGDDNVTDMLGNNIVGSDDGQDTINTGNGDDKIYGTGDGTDKSHIVDTGGNNIVDLEGSSDSVTLGTGNDQVSLGGGTNDLSEAGGDNKIQLTNGSDTVKTGNGSDTVEVYGGSAGDHDQISTGAGADSIFMAVRSELIAGLLTVDSGAGDDTVAFGPSGNLATVDANVNGGSGDDKIFALRASGGDGNDQLFQAMRQANGNSGLLDGGTGNDQLVGGSYWKAQSPHGGETPDLCRAAGSSPQWEADALASVNDHLVGGPGDDLLVGLAGQDIVDGGDGNDQITGGTLACNLTTKEIFGVTAYERGQKVNTLIGGSGNDQIALQSDDIVDGGSDNDQLTVRKADEMSPVGDVHGGDGTDNIIYDLSGSSFDTFCGVQVSLDDQANDGEYREPNPRSDLPLSRHNVHSDVEDVSGTNCGDYLVGSASANVLNGYSGSDTIEGGPGQDTLSHAGTGYVKMFARDGETDRVACGLDGQPPSGSVFSDPVDQITNCKDVNSDLKGGSGSNSSGQSTRCVVPALRGVTASQASQTLKKENCGARLNAWWVRLAQHANVVVGQDFAQEKDLPAGTVVTLKVGRKVTVNRCQIPRLLTKPFSAVEKAFRKQQCNLTVKYQRVTAKHKRGKVIAQSAHGRVRSATTITITLGSK